LFRTASCFRTIWIPEVMAACVHQVMVVAIRARDVGCVRAARARR